LKLTGLEPKKKTKAFDAREVNENDETEDEDSGAEMIPEDDIQLMKWVKEEVLALEREFLFLLLFQTKFRAFISLLFLFCVHSLASYECSLEYNRKSSCH
jgi:hypothetical protein